MSRLAAWLMVVFAWVAVGGFAPRANPRPVRAVDPVSAFDQAYDRSDNMAALMIVESAPARGGLDRIDPYRLLNLRAVLADPALIARLAVALDKAEYRPADALNCPDELWLGHAVATIDTSPAAAERALLRLCEPFTIIGVRLDRRFGPIVARHQVFFDPRSATERFVAAQKRYAKRHPDLAEPLISIALYETMLGRDPAALRRLDGVIAKGAVWSDWSSEQNSAFDFRAVVLSGLGRWDVAMDDWRAASLGADGEVVSSAYAKALTAVGRPAEALLLLEELKPRHPYLEVDADEARLCTLQALGRTAEARRIFETMPGRRDSNHTAVFRSLICLEDEEALAAEVIHWLNDPMLRGEMLIHLSVWIPPKSMSPAQAKRIALQRKMAARADVQSVVARVGRVERIDLLY